MLRKPAQTSGLTRNPLATRRRQAFTLLELLLSLSLIVVATGLVGLILQTYSRNFAEKSDEIRRKQLARAILHMIAEDIRAVVLEQEYDSSVLEAQLGAEGAGGGGDAADTTTGEADSGLASDTSSEADMSSDASATTETDLSTMMISDLPPGIYGDQSSLIVEVSRLPRYDEYIVQQVSVLEGTLTDVPGDIKRVQYFLQPDSTSGVADDMTMFSGAGDAAASAGFSSGLIRRALDPAVLAYAEEMADMDRLQRTGDLVAPEVVGLQFAFFDGLNGQWVYEWDSSQQSLPWLVQISLAMQSKKGTETSGELPVGTPISSLTLADQKMYGLEVFELVVAIPGANLVSAEAAADAEAAAGMETMGL